MQIILPSTSTNPILSSKLIHILRISHIHTLSIQKHFFKFQLSHIQSISNKKMPNKLEKTANTPLALAYISKSNSA